MYIFGNAQYFIYTGTGHKPITILYTLVTNKLPVYCPENGECIQNYPLNKSFDHPIWRDCHNNTHYLRPFSVLLSPFFSTDQICVSSIPSKSLPNSCGWRTEEALVWLEDGHNDVSVCDARLTGCVPCARCSLVCFLSCFPPIFLWDWENIKRGCV